MAAPKTSRKLARAELVSDDVPGGSALQSQSIFQGQADETVCKAQKIGNEAKTRPGSYSVVVKERA